MTRLSSIHFEPINDIRQAVSHSERTDLSEPKYLLPAKHRLPNIILPDSMSENLISEMFIKQQARMSRQARTASASPFWEGVVVLDGTDGEKLTTSLMRWKTQYEMVTGHTVCHIAIHLDEGFVDIYDVPQYNTHAHVILSRMSSSGKFLLLDKNQLSKVQDLTAETLNMKRGSTLSERKGKRGRKHISHREYRELADKKRHELNDEKVKLSLYKDMIDTLKANENVDREKLKQALFLENKVSKLEADLAFSFTQVNTIQDQYYQSSMELNCLIQVLKKDYEDLKMVHESALDDLKKEQLRTQEIIDLKQELASLKSLKQEKKKESNAVDEMQLRAYQTAENELDSWQFHQKSLASSFPAPIAEAAVTTVENLADQLFESSWSAMVQIIKNFEGNHTEVSTENSDYRGPIIALDNLLALQKIDINQFVIHKVKELDVEPQLENLLTEIRYFDGFGEVIETGSDRSRERQR